MISILVFLFVMSIGYSAITQPCPLCPSSETCIPCDEENVKYSQVFVDKFCPKENSLTDYPKCYMEGGFNLTAALDYCGYSCHVKNKELAFLMQCCIANYFNDQGNSTEEKLKRDKICFGVEI